MAQNLAFEKFCNTEHVQKIILDTKEMDAETVDEIVRPPREKLDEFLEMIDEQLATLKTEQKKTTAMRKERNEEQMQDAAPATEKLAKTHKTSSSAGKENSNAIFF